MELLFIMLIMALDQLVKFIAKTRLITGDIPIIRGYLELTYVENRGAAFGLFHNMRFLLVGVTLVVILAMLFYLLKNRNMKRGLKISLILIIGGAIGNLIDRVILKYVIDFIHFHIRDSFDWPVFNVADISVVCGTMLLAINILFDKER